jgi:hypothetical protein
MSGRAMLFKEIVRESSEVRSGFSQVPTGMNLAQGAALLDHAQASGAQVSEAGFVMIR